MKHKLGATINFLAIGPSGEDFGVFGEMEDSSKIRINSFEVVRTCHNENTIFVGVFDKKKEKLYLGGSSNKIEVMDYTSFKVIDIWEEVHTQFIFYLVMVEDMIFSCSKDRTVCVWDS
jgi:hypothetical protein